jgi:uncharacterized membrane protein (GlpM family)
MTTSTDERQGRVRYGAALGLLLTAYVLDAFDQEAVDILVSVIFVTVLGLLLLDPRTPRGLQVVGVVAGSVSILSVVIAEALDLGDTYLGVAHLSNVVVLAVAIVALIHRLGTMREVTISTVMGAVMTYAFIAFLAASVYRGIDLLTDEPFFAQGEVARSDYAYFSFVSLTTLGFGDLTPGTDLAKRLVVLETFTGQVFLVVAVAQLVSMWVPQRRRPSGDDA